MSWYSDRGIEVSPPAFDDLSLREQREYLANHEWERCEECGNRCPEGDDICGTCALGNLQTEDYNGGWPLYEPNGDRIDEI